MTTHDMQGQQAQTTLDLALPHLWRCGATGAVLCMSSGVRKNWKFENPEDHGVTLSCNDRSATEIFVRRLAFPMADHNNGDYDIQEGRRDVDISALL